MDCQQNLILNEFLFWLYKAQCGLTLFISFGWSTASIWMKLLFKLRRYFLKSQGKEKQGRIKMHVWEFCSIVWFGFGFFIFFIIGVEPCIKQILLGIIIFSVHPLSPILVHFLPQLWCQFLWFLYLLFMLLFLIEYHYYLKTNKDNMTYWLVSFETIFSF